MMYCKIGIYHILPHSTTFFVSPSSVVVAVQQQEQQDIEKHTSKEMEQASPTEDEANTVGCPLLDINHKIGRTASLYGPPENRRESLRPRA